MQKSLTDGFLRQVAPPTSGRLEYADQRCAGLVFRVTAGGAKSWSFRFRDPTTRRTSRATLGAYPALGLSEARTLAGDMRADVAKGGNPAARKRQDRAGASTTTFKALADRYMAEHSRRKKRSHTVDQRNLDNHILPKWATRPYAGIKRADAIELIEALVSAGKPTQANRVHSLISSIFSFAVDASLVEFNPVARLKKRGAENVGRRVLSSDEIRAFWHGIIEPVAVRRTGLGLRLALLTGCRIGEVAGLARGELAYMDDPPRAMWTIPGARTKNGRDHLVPLSRLAFETVALALEMIPPDEAFVFPTRARRRSGPMRGNSFTQAMAGFANRGGADLPSWRADPPSPHDLRRTVETRLAELRIPKEIRDRCLNHVPGDIGSKHYNLHDYADEKRAALSAWAVALASIAQTMESPNVVSISAVRARGV